MTNKKQSILDSIPEERKDDFFDSIFSMDGVSEEIHVDVYHMRDLILQELIDQPTLPIESLWTDIDDEKVFDMVATHFAGDGKPSEKEVEKAVQLQERID